MPALGGLCWRLQRGFVLYTTGADWETRAIRWHRLMADDLRPCSWPNTAMLVAHEKKKLADFLLLFSQSVQSQSSHTPKGVPVGHLGEEGR